MKVFTTLLLLFSLGFSQTPISSKYITIFINQNTLQIDFSYHIPLLDDELYIVTPFYLENFSTDCEQENEECNDQLIPGSCDGWDLEFKTSYYNTSLLNQDFQIDYDCEDWDDNGSYCKYFFEDPDIVIHSENSIMNGDYSDFYEGGCTIFSGDVHFKVTGVFEEDVIPDPGDVNSDGIIDVLDIVAMVNVILDGA